MIKSSVYRYSRFGIWERAIISLVCRDMLSGKGNRRKTQKAKGQKMVLWRLRHEQS